MGRIRISANRFLKRLRANGWTVSPLFLNSMTAKAQNIAVSSERVSPVYGMVPSNCELPVRSLAVLQTIYPRASVSSFPGEIGRKSLEWAMGIFVKRILYQQFLPVQLFPSMIDDARLVRIYRGV